MRPFISNGEPGLETHEWREENAPNWNQISAFEMDDEASSRTLVECKTGCASTAPIISSLDGPLHLAPQDLLSQALEMMQTPGITPSSRKRGTDTTEIATAEKHQRLVGVQRDPLIQSTLSHRGISEESQAIIDPSIVSSEDTRDSSTDTSLTVPSETPFKNHNNLYPRAKPVINATGLESAMEEYLNELVLEHVVSDIRSTISKARILKDALMTFHANRVGTGKSKRPQPDEGAVVDICYNALERPNRGIGGKVDEIVREVMALFGKGAAAQMVLYPPEETVNQEHISSRSPLNPGQATAAPNLPPQQKRSRPGNINSVETKRPRLHCTSSATLDAQEKVFQEHEPSMAKVTPGSKWRCQETGCTQKQPSKDRKSFVTHYNTHFPPTVYVCLLQKADGQLCCELWHRSDNLKSHLKSHNCDEPLPPLESLEKDQVVKSFQIHDLFHSICPFCKDDRQLSSPKISREHIVNHYAKGCSQNEFFDRCPKKHGSWKCSIDIPEEYRRRGKDSLQQKDAVSATFGLGREQRYPYSAIPMGNGSWHFDQNFGGEFLSICGSFGGNEFLNKGTVRRNFGLLRAVADVPGYLNEESSTTLSDASHGSSGLGRITTIPSLVGKMRVLTCDDGDVHREIGSAAFRSRIPLERYLADFQRHELIACGHETDTAIKGITMKMELKMARGRSDIASTLHTFEDYKLMSSVSRCLL